MPHWRPSRVEAETPFVGFCLLFPAMTNPALFTVNPVVVGPGHVVQRRIEVEHVAILFRHAAVVVVTNAGGDAEVGQGLPLVLHIAVDFIGAIVAIGVVAVRGRIDTLHNAGAVSPAPCRKLSNPLTTTCA